MDVTMEHTLTTGSVWKKMIGFATPLATVFAIILDILYMKRGRNET